jgi:hypothetical protein
MEAQVEVSTPAPQPAPQPAVATPTPAPAVAPATPQMENGGFMENVTKPKMKFVDLFIAGLLIATQIYLIVDTRRRIKIENAMPTREEFDNFVDDFNEVKYNVQKQLGKKYIKT